MKAIGAFIFGGSATFGVEKAGFTIDKVLEMTNDMHELNAYHFVKNRPDIPLIPPSDWENDEYLSALKAENYDLLYSNCPCSSLSQINRNASLNGANNVQFYRVFNIIRGVQPKAFFIENAPTLVKLGYPILVDMVKQLKDLYKFTIIRDFAGNHGVPMKRQRTLVVGWRKDCLNEGIPVLHMNHMEPVKTKDILCDLYELPVGTDKIPNHTLLYDKGWSEIEHLFHYVKPDSSAMLAFIENWEVVKDEITDPSVIREILKGKEKIDTKGRLWDKTPWRPSEDNFCPSVTSVTKCIHPTKSRTFTIREYARLMGYPDDFVFYEGGKTDIIQCIAQGVPSPFTKYVAGEIKEVFSGNRGRITKNLVIAGMQVCTEDTVLAFQHHGAKIARSFTFEELVESNELDYKNNKEASWVSIDK